MNENHIRFNKLYYFMAFKKIIPFSYFAQMLIKAGDCKIENKVLVLIKDITFFSFIPRIGSIIIKIII